MRRVITVVIVALVVSSCAQTVNLEQEKAALLATDAEWSKAAKNVDSFVSFLAPDATLALAGAPAIKGEAVIKSALAPMMQAPGFDLSWQPVRAEVSSSGDLGYTVGTYTLTTTNMNGVPVTEKGKTQTTWKKINGAWKVIEDTATSDAPAAMLSPPVAVPAAAVKWIDAPAVLPKGAKLAVISGDPGKPEAFTIRLQLPDGYMIAPHTHPTDEHVTVLSGTLQAAMGNTWDDKAFSDFPAGSYANMATGTAHYVKAKGTTVVQLHGVGPFIVNYVNPADDPSKK
jgi:ketosteroid isomerase-like protein/quercetin dioxygenase-like cupin family protein